MSNPMVYGPSYSTYVRTTRLYCGEPIGDLSALENPGAIALIQVQARK